MFRMDRLLILELSLTAFEMVIMTVVAILIVVKIRYDKRFSFFVQLCLLIIIADISTVLLDAGECIDGTYF